MILSDRTIKTFADKVIVPFQADNVNPSSYDLSLSGVQSINFRSEHFDDNLERDGEIKILPGESFLAATIETISLPNNITGEIVNKSSTGRKGLFLASSGWVDPGFRGQLTVAMKNESMKPLVLKYGQRLWQIVFADCEEVESLYEGHYQDSQGVVPDKTKELEKLG